MAKVSDDIKIGFIGSGKVGITLGAYFKEKGLRVAGYLSRTFESAQQAAQITGTHAYLNISHLAKDCNTIFITTPDDQIKNAWNELKQNDISKKIICHTSGALSSTVFTGIELCGAYGYSIHPIYAFSEKSGQTKGLTDSCFTIEGDACKIDIVKDMVSRLGNRAVIIEGDKKVYYHIANVIASNLVLALLSMGSEVMKLSEISGLNPMDAMMPLIKNNIQNIAEKGFADSLTGPVERNDTATIEKHLLAMPPKFGRVYAELSLSLVEISQQKHADRDYTKMADGLKEYMSELI